MLLKENEEIDGGGLDAWRTQSNYKLWFFTIFYYFTS